MAKKEKRGSLKYQITKRMKEMGCFGQSRHQAKEEYRAMVGKENTHNRTVGIHSHKTFDAYKSSVNQFITWAKEEGRGLRNIEDVTEEHIKDYIKYREQEGYSAYTYSKDLAALNKVFNTEVTKKDCEVANRSYKDISNNRGLKEHHKKINYDNYKDEITVLKSTGMRRESLEKVTPNSFNYDENGTPVAIRLADERNIGGANMKEKGGRARVAEIPREMQGELKTVIDNKVKANGGDKSQSMFSNVSKKLGCHRFRQDYAKSMYKQYIGDNGTSEQWRGYDKNAMNYVSENLGHNREDVVKYNYLSA